MVFFSALLAKLYRSNHTLILLILLLVWLAFFWRVWTPIENDQLTFAEGDFSGQFVAWTHYALERLNAGEFPLWNPYHYGGAPFQASSQTALFYPPRTLTLASLLIEARLFGDEALSIQAVYAALQREAMLHVLAVTLFMYAFVWRLLREYYAENLPLRFGAFMAAITYGYGGYLTGYPILQIPLLEAGVWLPLILLGILNGLPLYKDYANQIKWPWLIFSGAMLGICLLAGHPQTALFSIYVMAAWLAYRVWETKLAWRRGLLILIFIGLIGGGLAAVQLLPTAEFSLQTYRADLTFEAKGGGFSFFELANMLFPLRGVVWNANYLGLLPLLLIVLALWRGATTARLWAALLAIAALLTFGTATPIYGWLYPILPGLSFFRGQERAMFIVAQCAAILVGLGAVELMQAELWNYTRIKRRAYQVLGLLLAVCLLYAGLMYGAQYSGSSQGDIADRFVSAVLGALMFAAALLGLNWFVKDVAGRARQAALILWLIFDLFSAGAMLKLNYEAVPLKERLNPPPLVATLRAYSTELGTRVDSTGGLFEGYSTLYRLLDINGSDPLQLEAMRFYLEDLPPYRRWELLAVGVVLDDGERVATSAARVGQLPHADILAFDDPRPFAHPVYTVTRVANDAEARGLLREPAFNPREVVTLTKDAGQLSENPPNEDERGSARVVRFQPERIEIETDTPQAAILTLALPHFSGWRAQVDGQTTPLLRAYGGLSAVYIPQGAEHVILNYHSQYLGFGAFISTQIGLFIFISFGLSLARRRRRKQRK